MFLKPYNHLIGYLERWTILKVGRLHVRFHVIKDRDRTPYLHTHPFSYISVILKGGYTESLLNSVHTYKRFSIIWRSSKTFHRLTQVNPDTITLFITWTTKSNKWELMKGLVEEPSWINYPSGIYQRKLNNGIKYAKFNNYWFKGHEILQSAIEEKSPSINQTTKPLNLFLHDYIGLKVV